MQLFSFDELLECVHRVGIKWLRAYAKEENYIKKKKNFVAYYKWSGATGISFCTEIRNVFATKLLCV